MCDACKGVGWLEVFKDRTGYGVERCDACEKYPDDTLARYAALVAGVKLARPSVKGYIPRLFCRACGKPERKVMGAYTTIAPNLRVCVDCINKYYQNEYVFHGARK